MDQHSDFFLNLFFLGPYRFLRIMQNGKNASDQTCYLSLSGFEVYGPVVDVVVGGKLFFLLESLHDEGFKNFLLFR